MMKKLTVGIVGLGRMGKSHAKNLAKRIGGVQLAAVVSTNKESQTWAKDELGVQYVFEDLNSLLTRPEIDAVVLATPSNLHADQSIAVLESGKHLFVEKPLAMSVSECEKVEAVAKRCKEKYPHQIAMVGFVRRFDPSYASARQAIVDGDIGKPFFVRSQTGDMFDPSGFFVKFAPTSGGIFIDASVHDIDLARWFMSDKAGKPPKALKVYATGVRAVHPEMEACGDVDNGMATIEFDDGHRAVLYASRTLAHGHETSAEIIGTQGKLLIGSGAAKDRVIHSSANGVGHIALKDFYDRFESAFEHEMQAFVDACLGKVAAPLSLSDATEATRIAEAITRSLHSGQVELVA